MMPQVNNDVEEWKKTLEKLAWNKGSRAPSNAQSAIGSETSAWNPNIGNSRSRERVSQRLD
jgi:hypothetical protein